MARKAENPRAAARSKAEEELELALEKMGVTGAGRRLSEQKFVKPVLISTRTIGIDRITYGGVPRGRITEIYGTPGSGKTALCLMLIAEVQAAGGEAALVDAEFVFDPDWSRTLGVSVENLRLVQPDNGEQALDAVQALVTSGVVDIIVVDSVAGLVPKAEIEGDSGDAVMGAQARLMSQALRKLAGAVSRSNCALVFINQTREKIGVMFGNPETTTGGKALPFWASLRLNMRPTKPIKAGETQIGRHIKVKVEKSKQGPPMRTAEIPFMFDMGFDTVGEMLDEGATLEVFEKSGSWYSYQGERVGQGREAAIGWLRQNAAAQSAARSAILAAHAPEITEEAA